ncbi:glycosyltransferase family 39 protein [Nostoc sp. C052]|uniref:glycosyltransferase family 39 protein n=1 Tax=Nostoc sp. C052 TaxID=2576902 RepID=UPI0021187989|nr:glycosyltransferase family 39 protein [Nostoc sp. C052]
MALGLLLGSLMFSIWEKIPTSVERVNWSQQAHWIAPQTPTYRFYTRNTFNLSDNATAAWLRISADNDFTLYVNGREIAKENNVTNSSRGLGAGLRLPLQDINDSNRYDAKTSANYLLASSNDWKLTAYVDLTRHLQPGKNVIALEIQKGKTNPRVVVEGAVYLTDDATPISLSTGETTWRVSNLSETRQSLQWFDRDFSDENWLEAKVLGSVRETTYSRLSKNLFDRRLQGNWITGNQSSQGQVWLRGSWQIPTNRILRTYIRFAGQGTYSLLLNGNFINSYRADNGKQLHLLEITKFIQPGNNILAVSLTSPINTLLTSVKSIKSNSILNFFLDGWAETVTGEIIGEIATDNAWTALNQPVSGWTKGVGNEKSVSLLGLPKPEDFQRNFEGNAYLLNYPNYLWCQSLWLIGGVVLAIIYASLLGFWLGYGNRWWENFTAGSAILSPSILFLAAIGLLKHRFAEAEVGLLFAQPQSNYVILFGFTAIIALTLVYTRVNRNINKLPLSFIWFSLGLVACVSCSLASGGNVFSVFILALVAAIIAYIFVWMQKQEQSTILILQDKFNLIQQRWPIWGEWIFLILIVSVGFGLRVYNLDFIDLDSDENTSLDASRGILRTGAPIATSGIWYTRSPFYHYLLAFWLRVVGDSIVNARLLSVIWGTATLVLVYIVARKVTGKVWIALLVALVLAVEPCELWYSRFIRCYQILQFFTIFSFWSFLKGFIEKSGRHYQYLFFVSLTLSLLTQEINLTVIPVFFIGFIYFYRPFSLRNDWQIFVCSLMTSVIFIYNLAIAAIRNITPLAALSNATASYLRLHFADVTDLFAMLLIGPDRTHTVLSFFFLLGFIYFLKIRDQKVIFLFSAIFINLVLITVLTYNLAERYVYSLYPLIILLSIYSAICLIEALIKGVGLLVYSLPHLKSFALFGIVILIVFNIQPMRVLATYDESLTRRNNELLTYVRTHREAKDIVISPMSSFASISLVKLDYYLFSFKDNENFDTVYWHDGKLIDRWAGGVILNSVDQLNHILEKSERVWINIDDVRNNRVTPELRDYIKKLGKPVFETFGTRLRLWQPEDGLPNRIPNKGKDLGAY